MTGKIGMLNSVEYKRFTICPVKCPILKHKVESLAGYFDVISASIAARDKFWFRGHSDVGWSLAPSALRYKRHDERERALRLISEFKRIAEIKLPRLPGLEEEFKWAQQAQHYGVPTRLLDWTESATVALYFACLNATVDGIVFILNPVDLNRMSFPQKPRILDAGLDASIIKMYMKLDVKRRNRGPKTVAVNPVLNSERLMLQKGVFTLHGSRFELDRDQAPSLVGLPILRESKAQLLIELERVGVDEMSIFPELEHSCKFLVRREGLESGT
jgi:hypothetical protein